MRLTRIETALLYVIYNKTKIQSEHYIIKFQKWLGVNATGRQANSCTHDKSSTKYKNKIRNKNPIELNWHKRYISNYIEISKKLFLPCENPTEMSGEFNV